MRYLIVYFFLLFMQPLTGWSQQWAGPDVEVCERGSQKQLGSDAPCVDCCYSWSPRKGLNCYDCKRPYLIEAKDPIEYTVVVYDQYLKKIGEDKVFVDLAFGNIHFTPKVLIESSDDTVQAELLVLSDDFDPQEIYWDFIGDDLGCSMNVNEEGYSAWIAPGNDYGTITVEARYLGEYEGECRAEADIDVNNGVKDVWAIDHTQPGRIAKNGDTLYVLNESRVNISAKPNEGGFKAGVPDWKADAYGSTTPMDGLDSVATFEDPALLPGRISQYIAGEAPDDPPKVTVIRRFPVPEWTQPISIPGMDTLDKFIKKYFTFFNSAPITPCGTLDPFSLSLSLPSLEYKISEIEKYNDPNIGKKQVLKIATSISAAGKIFHPGFTKTFTFRAFGVDLFLCSRLYAELTGMFEANMEFVQNDSLPDPDWTAQSPQVTAGFGVSGNFEFAFTPPGYLLTASARIKSSIEMTFGYVSETKVLNHTLKVDPATAKLEAKLQQESDPGKFEDILGGRLNLSKTIVLIKGGTHGPYDLYQF